MFALQCLLFCFLASCAIGVPVSVPFIQPCKPTDRACHKASALVAQPYFVQGVPELGLPPADPILIDDVRSDDKGIKLGFRNMTVTGIKKCIILDFIRDLDKSTMTLIMECPITATGQYSLHGKLLFIPAEGDGDFEIKTGKTKIEITVKIKAVEHGGEKYWKITGFDYNYDLIDKASISAHNLFGGDETRAKPLEEIFANSSNDLIKELGDPIIRELFKKEIDIVRRFLKSVPISSLELP